MIIIDEVEFLTDDYKLVNQDENPEKRELSFEFQVQGISDYNLYNNSLNKGPVEIKIPDEKITFKAKRGNFSTSYVGTLNPQTLVTFRVTYRECDEGDKQWDLNTGQSIVNVQNWLRVKTLIELLDSKNIVSKDEFQEKYGEVMKRDNKKMINYLTQGVDFEDDDN